jgi:sporulation protein YlmC with PRC-barrel domain
MDISVNATVQCKDAPAGHTTSVIIDPQTKIVTHIVVETKTFPKEEHIVPIDLIEETTPTKINLHCKRTEVENMEVFLDHEFIHVNTPIMKYASQSYVMWPYVEPEQHYVDVVHEHIPPGELALHRGAKVVATDGPVGQIDELLVEPEQGHITHIVLRKGHLWGKKDVTIPIPDIDKIQEDQVQLKIDKGDIAKLPTIPIRRLWP